jgi:hypothetical protein
MESLWQIPCVSEIVVGVDVHAQVNWIDPMHAAPTYVSVASSVPSLSNVIVYSAVWAPAAPVLSHTPTRGFSAVPAPPVPHERSLLAAVVAMAMVVGLRRRARLGSTLRGLY